LTCIHHGDSFQATCSRPNGQCCRAVCVLDQWPARGELDLALTADNEKEDNPGLEPLMKTKLLLLPVGFFACACACLAQGSRPGQSAPGPGATTTAGDPTKYLNRDWENVYNQGRTGDHVRGNVTLAEGALPWDAIPVVVATEKPSSRQQPIPTAIS
jgi:hypothetical protein